jgi:hypothetical protein
LLTTASAFVASIPPLGTLVFERWATRTGRLTDPASAPDSPDQRGARLSCARADRDRGELAGSVVDVCDSGAGQPQPRLVFAQPHPDAGNRAKASATTSKLP